MKNLKTYKLFESVDKDIIKDIEDILLEINDENNRIIGYVEYENIYNKISIENYKRDGTFQWKDIKETVLRLIDFLKINTISIKYIISDNCAKTINDFLSSISDDDYLRSVLIFF